MSSNFNLFYHGSASDISDALEAGADLDQYEAKALLCNIVRRIAMLEEKAGWPAPVRKRYKVAAIKMVAFGRVHKLDESVEGCYFYDAINEEDALDQFHLDVPIKVLEDFEFDVEEDQ
jgi:hypothetical protein